MRAITNREPEPGRPWRTPERKRQNLADDREEPHSTEVAQNPSNEKVINNVTSVDIAEFAVTRGMKKDVLPVSKKVKMPAMKKALS